MADPSLLEVDTGAGRWFVFERVGGDPYRLIAGPYQTKDAADRWFWSYAPPDGVESVMRIRCEGTWQDAVAHAENALAEWRQRGARWT